MESSKCTEKVTSTVHPIQNIGEAVSKPESKQLDLPLETEDREFTVTGEVLYCETLSVVIQNYIASCFLFVLVTGLAVGTAE